MNLATRMLNAMTCEGNRFQQAWLSACACYHYTRSHDGAQMSDDPNDVIRFSRWYSFKGAVALGWEYLWRPYR